MEKVKELSKELIVKIKVMIGIVIAGLVVAAAAWRKHVQDELATVEQKAKEQAIKDEAAAKLAAETAKLEEQKKAEQAKIEAESKQKQAELDAKKEKDSEKLKKADSSEVKKAAAESLGLKEVKKKGRPKK